ncbi:uncharacterized protein LOC133724117 [Rosa rugosa]|uniref:uncharacterized protein LOC133724117 n=1 Tax=Rosa rugosa TaxID=74645 RepID=UPI002B40C4AC|nr:uncharacterized protein LOC133724117 [Rosa rugosa]
MSSEGAADFALKALFMSTFYDKWCGGTLHVYHVHENGYQEKRSLDALEVYSRYYNIYDLYTYEPMTFLLLYSTDYQPIAGDDLINLGSDEGLVAAHLVAKKRDFNIHRLVFNSENEASTAYEAIAKVEPRGASRFPRLQNFRLCELKIKSKRVPVYVQKSSSELLQSICELPPAPETNQCWLPRIIRLPSCFGCA